MIEVTPEAKRRLYSALALSGSTLKDWFLKTAADFCAESVQPSLFPKASPNTGESTSDRAAPSAKDQHKQ